MDILNKKIGIIGGGQLGKMMILEAKRLGFYCITLDPTLNCPSHSLSDEHIVSAFDDIEKIEELAEKSDIITYEIEHISVEALKNIERKGHIVYPSVSSLEIIQDKYLQKKKLQDNEILVPAFFKVEYIEQIIDVPVMLKATKGGYDGRGNFLIKDKKDIEKGFKVLGGKDLIAEEVIPFIKEISVIACRTINGKRKIYPVAENIHKENILDTTIVPARISDGVAEKAKKIADKVMDIFDGVGTFCIEMFVTSDNKIYVNEVAPRPHNSGHYTIEGCFVNQFENHIRAIMGLSLGSTDLRAPTVMKNILGESKGKTRVVGLAEALENQNVRVHIYGKANSNVKRKMGHLTAIGETLGEALESAENAKKKISILGEEK